MKKNLENINTQIDSTIVMKFQKTYKNFLKKNGIITSYQLCNYMRLGANNNGSQLYYLESYTELGGQLRFKYFGDFFGDMFGLALMVKYDND